MRLRRQSAARPSQNGSRLDDIRFNDCTNEGPGSVPGRQTGVDAIREFSVLSTQYSAEYGRTLGGVGGMANLVFGCNSYEVHDDAFLTYCNHSLKFWVALERIQANSPIDFSYYGGFKFDSLAVFLSKNSTRFAASPPAIAFPRGSKQGTARGYIQDNSRVRSDISSFS
jgi:hypothetical protein